jgi:ribosomal protein S12 methylthiotransferase
MEFERLGVFMYSHEENTSAHDFEDDVPGEIKEERAAILMEIQQEISTKKNDEKIGKTFKVLIDRKEGGYFVGRTEFDSPEVDNEVLIDAKKHFCRVGDFVEATIDDATDFDLYASL